MAPVKQPRHGGNIYAASRELGQDLTKLIDFSASINPLGPSPSVWRAIHKARHVLHHYPDPDCWELRQVLAERSNTAPNQIVLGNGSTELIDVLPRALNIRHLLIVQPTFSEYATSVERTGGCVTVVRATRAEQYAQPIDRLCRLLEDAPKRAKDVDAVLLCNPNSPSGQAATVKELTGLAHMTRRLGIWLVLDEAFTDYCPERSFLPHLASWPHVVILRSLTKFYALPGLRVGYAVATRSVSNLFRRHMPPWSINALGQVAALAALSDTAHIQKSLRFMARERTRFGKLLAALPGCSVMPTYTNYFFVELPRGWLARKVTEHLRSNGVLIRDCSSIPGAGTRFIRVAVRSQRENDQLVHALSKLLYRSVS